MSDDSTVSVLLVEDNPRDAKYIRKLLSELDWEDRAGGHVSGRPDLMHVESLSSARSSLTNEDVDVVLLDLNLPDSRNLDTVEGVVEQTTDEAVVVLTGLDDEWLGSQAVERGAQDYLVKDDIDATLLDRTVRYAIERQRRELALQRRNEELVLLNRIVRHDIRDDMALIQGWGETLTEYVDREGQQYLDRMLEASSHVLDVTVTVREFLEALQTRDDLELQEVDLKTTIESEIEKARDVHENAQIDIDGKIPSVTVSASDLLSSVFRNLLSNAIQHNDAEQPRVKIQAERTDGTAIVRVADNGPGIEESRRDAIFGRTDEGLADADCGVGLYLVDTLVDMYGGSVRVDDNEPRGSVFTVRLEEATAE